MIKDHQAEFTFYIFVCLFRILYRIIRQVKMRERQFLASPIHYLNPLLHSSLHPPPPPTRQLSVQPTHYLPSKPLFKNQQKFHHNVHQQKYCPPRV